ncbi:hypothetical protein C4559_00130 [Candidatus Microgenomates bacterium]|nr:MAG: hypothetical protein C4559_00130 [Candidatus Microgenomates bacterium]
MNNRSRLSRRLEKQSKKTFLITIFAILFIIFFLVKFGFPLLVNFSLLLMGSKNTTESSQKSSSFFVPPPVLDSITDATNSAQIKISGTSSEKQIIKLYINGEVIDKVTTQKDGTFVFEDVKLSQGENSIKVKAIIKDSSGDEKESDYSKSYSVIFKNSPPPLTADSPTDGQSFSKDENNITVSGKTDSGNKVTVNDFWAIVDGEGNYSYTLHLQNGENKLKIVAIDQAGNKTEVERKINYSP